MGIMKKLFYKEGDFKNPTYGRPLIIWKCVENINDPKNIFKKISRIRETPNLALPMWVLAPKLKGFSKIKIPPPPFSFNVR